MQIVHHLVLSYSFSRELLQKSPSPCWVRLGVIQHCTVLSSRGDLLLDNWTILKRCPWTANVPLQPDTCCFTWSCNCSSWHVSSWRAIEKSDRAGIGCFQSRHSLIFSTASPIRYEHQAGDDLGQTTTQQHCVVSGVQRRAQLPERRGTRSNKSNWQGLRQY